MQYALKKKNILSKVALLGGVLLVLFIVGYFLGVIREDCGHDKVCFNERLNKCTPSEVQIVKNSNVYEYSIGNSLGVDCHLKVSLLKVQDGAPAELRKLLEGKSMKCAIPKERVVTANLDEFTDMMQYCTGPLKEGLYELIIQRMYGSVFTRMDDIVDEVQQSLKK